MDRFQNGSSDGVEQGRPRWRTPQLRVESVATLTSIDPVSTLPTDGSIYPNLGNNS